MADEVLKSWSDGQARDAILDFVRSVTEDGPAFVPPEDRVATFDNDGTLWCEKPMPIQLDFILRRFAARRRPSRSCANVSRGRRPSKVTTRGSRRS